MSLLSGLSFLIIMFITLGPGTPTAANQDAFRASAIIDSPVVNHRDREMGDVEDLVLKRRGVVKRAILSVGGFLGVGDRLVAVPFKALNLKPKKAIEYGISQEELVKHPEFSYQQEDL